MSELCPQNLSENIPDELPDELVSVLHEKGGVRIERIVSRGQVSTDWYDQETDEFVVLVKGEARLLFEADKREVTMREGAYCFIRAHERHRVVWTSVDQETIWLAVHMRT